MGIIKFNNTGISPEIKKKQALKRFLAAIFAQERVSLNRLDYIFCDDDFLIDLNRKYLDHDTYTDIITFAMSDPSAPIVAEIYISIDRVRENARKLQLDYHQELQRVMIHGVLHLCDLEDNTPEAKKTMRAREDHYLAQISST